MDFPEDKLSCPICRSRILYFGTHLVCDQGHKYGLIDGIPNLIPPDVEITEGVRPFEELYERYDSWYDRHKALYESEILAIKAIKSDRTDSIEIGVGTGRFAEALGIPYGIDASINVLRLARNRGIKVVRGIAERLPFKNSSFDSALIAFTICFVDDPIAMLKEASRVIRRHIVIGFVPKDSSRGKYYSKIDSPFYSVAKFYTFDEIMEMMPNNMRLVSYASTLFGEPGVDPDMPEEPIIGNRSGGFIVAMFEKTTE